MLLHASCAARDGRGVLLLGPSGAGKSDLLLRLLDRDFLLVADDQVELTDGLARPPDALAGLLEIRGLGVVCLPFVAPIPLSLAVHLRPGDRLPCPAQSPYGVPEIAIDPAPASAAQRVAFALDCALGRIRQISGAFAW